ncbi:MAG: hypothetical protein J6C33_05395 [Lachnospiraceae bacterium]|nr:hypothetical protein [Lachnospiraceae bacterium]
MRIWFAAREMRVCMKAQGNADGHDGAGRLRGDDKAYRQISSFGVFCLSQ